MSWLYLLFIESRFVSRNCFLQSELLHLFLSASTICFGLNTRYGIMCKQFPVFNTSAGGADLFFVCIARWLHILYRNFGPGTDICRKNYRLLWHAPKSLSQCDCTMTRPLLSSSGLGLLVSADYIWARFLCTSPLVSHRKLGRLHISLQIICHHNGREKVLDVFDTCSVCNKD